MKDRRLYRVLTMLLCLSFLPVAQADEYLKVFVSADNPAALEPQRLGYKIQGQECTDQELFIELRLTYQTNLEAIGKKTGQLNDEVSCSAGHKAFNYYSSTQEAQSQTNAANGHLRFLKLYDPNTVNDSSDFAKHRADDTPPLEWPYDEFMPAITLEDSVIGVAAYNVANENQGKDSPLQICAILKQNNYGSRPAHLKRVASESDVLDVQCQPLDAVASVDERSSWVFTSEGHLLRSVYFDRRTMRQQRLEASFVFSGLTDSLGRSTDVRVHTYYGQEDYPDLSSLIVQSMLNSLETFDARVDHKPTELQMLKSILYRLKGNIPSESKFSNHPTKTRYFNGVQELVSLVSGDDFKGYLANLEPSPEFTEEDVKHLRYLYTRGVEQLHSLLPYL